jgi:N-dimethylarginine dimethylaminohydrolase
MNLLMCHPNFFSVEYEINPWMNINNRPDTALARVQWIYAVETLSSLGCEMTFVDPVKDQPDMVFTANSALVYGRQAILGRFRHKERQGEEPHYEAWFKKHGYEIHHLPGEMPFEGEGDITFYGDFILMGYGQRTDVRVHPRVAEIVGKKAISLELIDPSFYHLDTCLVHIPEADLILFYPGAFSPKSAGVIRGLPSRILEVGEEDARHFVCNSVPIGKSLVLNRSTPGLQRDLENRGIRLRFSRTSEFMKAGGSVRCMVLHLN